MHQEIPEKSSFVMDEVCEITQIRPYVLRFWEAEFPEISPMVTSDGKKTYEYRDLEIIVKIKDLLFGQKLTIEKAKQRIKDFVEGGEAFNKTRTELKSDVSVEDDMEKLKAFYNQRSQNILGKIESVFQKTDKMLETLRLS